MRQDTRHGVENADAPFCLGICNLRRPGNELLRLVDVWSGDAFVVGERRGYVGGGA